MAKTTDNASTSKPPTKSQIHTEIAEKTDVAKRDVSAVFDALEEIMTRSLKKHGKFTLPGLAKMEVKKKPATKARKGKNPFTGEEMMFKAKPASKTVKVRPLKGLKDAV